MIVPEGACATWTPTVTAPQRAVTDCPMMAGALHTVVPDRVTVRLPDPSWFAVIVIWRDGSDWSVSVTISATEDCCRLHVSGSLRPAASPPLTGEGEAADDPPAPLELLPASRFAGVPAALAQPACNGPPAVQAASAMTLARLITIPEERARAQRGQPTVSRQTRVSPTAPTHTTTRKSAHSVFVSVPVPMPCSTATGHEAYAVR